MVAANFKKKIKDRSGFSLAEVLVTVIILLLVTATVATGIPAASRAYSKVVDAANAQVLMSTTIIRLREELGTADNIVVSNDENGQTVISYDNSFGVRNEISKFPKAKEKTIYFLNDDGTPDRNTIKGKHHNIFIHEYVDYDPRFDFFHPLVSDSAAGQKLIITYGDATYSEGVITFSNIGVYNGNYVEEDGEIKIQEQTPLAQMDSFKIRTLTYIS